MNEAVESYVLENEDINSIDKYTWPTNRACAFWFSSNLLFYFWSNFLMHIHKNQSFELNWNADFNVFVKW